MIQTTTILEHVVIVAKRGDAGWEGMIEDAMEGQSVYFSMTDDQFGAMMALATSDGFSSHGDLETRLRAIIEPVMAGWPVHCRPIP